VPKKIVLLRHAEEADDENSLDLSPQGRLRAEKLAKYVPKAFGTPQFVFAAAPSDSSVRCYLTVRVLADALNLQIDGSYRAREFAALAAKLFGDPVFDDAIVVIAWTHKELPSLAAYLNVRRSDFPRSWDEEVFNVIYELTYRRASRPKVRRIKQPF
jgi:broad specificity phosphatase PhoE